MPSLTLEYKFCNEYSTILHEMCMIKKNAMRYVVNNAWGEMNLNAFPFIINAWSENFEEKRERNSHFKTFLLHFQKFSFWMIDFFWANFLIIFTILDQNFFFSFTILFISQNFLTSFFIFIQSSESFKKHVFFFFF